MLVTPVPIVLPAPLSTTPRTVGVHVSGIIRAIAMETGILEAQYVEDLSLIDVGDSRWWDRLPPEAQLRIHMGLAWEEHYLRLFPSILKHPGELQLDGVYMTPDGESLDFVCSLSPPDVYEHALHEVKFTYKSTKTVGDFTDQWLWVSQTQAYAKAKGTRIVYVHVLFACGNYKFPIVPWLGPMGGKKKGGGWVNQPSIYRIEFTQEEIDTKWELLIDYMQSRLAQE